MRRMLWKCLSVGAAGTKGEEHWVCGVAEIQGTCLGGDK